MLTVQSHNRTEVIAFGDIVEWLNRFDITKNFDVEHKARLLLLDTLACAIAGLAEKEPHALATRLAKSDNGSLTLPSINGGLSILDWVFALTTSACWHEACEGSARAHGRPGLHAIPVAAGLGLEKNKTFGEVLESLVWGYEIGARAGETMRISEGLHVDGTWGILASIAAACRMYALSPEQTVTALAAGACQVPHSLYFPISKGCTVRNIYAGAAATQAIHIADAVAAGVTAPHDVFETTVRTLSGNPAQTQWAWSGPDAFLIMEAYLKPFAAVRHVHYAAACAQQWHTRHGQDKTQNITALTLNTYPEAAYYCSNRSPQTAIQAQFSLTFGAAHVLRHGDLTPDAYRLPSFDDPETRRLENLISVTENVSSKERSAQLIVQMGNTEEVYAIAAIPGDISEPFTETEARGKALTYMSPVIGEEGAERLIGKILSHPLADTFTFW